MAEQNVEQHIKVRQVTDVQASWTETERGEHGLFTIQLILDDGAEEYVLRPTAEDAKVMLKLFRRSEAVYFDLDRKVLISRVRKQHLARSTGETGGISVAESHPAPERNVEEQITVRQVTDVHANWSEQERGAPGKFSFQLILDSGAEEYAIRPPAEDADVLMDLFKRSDTIYFDMGRQVLIFGDISLG
jgi:hypothetical protein